jgi:hypothetical protein
MTGPSYAFCWANVKKMSERITKICLNISPLKIVSQNDWTVKIRFIDFIGPPVVEKFYFTVSTFFHFLNIFHIK